MKSILKLCLTTTVQSDILHPPPQKKKNKGRAASISLASLHNVSHTINLNMQSI